MNSITIILLFMCLLSFCAFCGESDLEWPEITKQTRPWSRWWWMGNILEKDDLSVEMEKYRKAGLGGLEITPIYGVKGYENRFIDYLSPRWMEMFDHTLREASRLGLGIDMATGTGWPFGGPWIDAEDACKNFVHKTYTLKGGESLSEPIVYLQKPLVHAIGHRVAISELKEPLSANLNLQALGLEQVRFEKRLSPLLVMAFSDKGESLNLSDKVDGAGKLSWVAPGNGNWTLYALFQGWHGKLVERAAPGGEGNVIDHFSDRALGNYLKKFDQAFAGYDISSLRAFFNDSYEVDDAEGESNWTDDFLDEFRKRRGYDLRDNLPALFGNDSVEKNSRVRCDYRETISDLLLEKFTIPWRQWAKSKGAMIRDQAHGSPANILDLYAASDIPETEGADIQRIKFASSAANVMGKKLASSESATWLNEHFISTLGDVKQAVDRFFLGGVNHIFYHGTPYSPASEEWPGRLFYASVHFGPTNSFWNDFPALNSYVARCQSFLQSGRPDNDVLLYYPIHDSWSQPGKNLLIHYGQGIEGAMSQNAGVEMLRKGYAYDLISDRQLTQVEIKGGSLQTGGNSYKVIVLPECGFIPLSTFERLIELAGKGATIVVQNKLPADVSGWGNLEERRSRFKNLVSSLRLTQVNGDVQSAKVGAGRFLLGKDLERLLAVAGVKREKLVDQGLQFVRRKYEKGRYYFLLNSGKETFEGWVPMETEARAAAIFNPMLAEKGMAAQRRSENGIEVYLQLSAGESCILKTFAEAVTGPAYGYFKAKGEPNNISGAWSVKFIEGGPELPAALETRDLGSWTEFGGEAVKKFSGTARYTISFDKPKEDADGWLLDLGRVCESARVSLNGKALGTLITTPFRLRISSDLLKEKNTIEIDVSNL
ncbi:MAG: glycoside hydrolase family 2 protein, partial [Blastocatellia bacterium]|nr:glycoside hydrolase family 2 protein [Blastocatellia bacterium]